MVTAGVQPRNANRSQVYNLDCCLAVLFLQGRHGPDLIPVALAGRVGDAVALLRPQS